MKVAIIGAGEMGRWFTKFFSEAGIPVMISDKDEQRLSKIRKEFGVEIGDNKNVVKSADIVMICVPVEHFVSVMKEINSYVRSDQMVIDICTVKNFPVRAMHKYVKNGMTLGSHPMFGPDVKSIKYQNVILTPTNSKEEMLAKKFKDLLEKQQAKVFIMSPEKHDKFMNLIFRLPRGAAFFLYHTNKRLPSVLSIAYRLLSII